MLTSERGFSYTKKDDYPKSRTWRCPCRGGVKFKRCNAKVIQVKRSESFLTVYQQEDFFFFLTHKKKIILILRIMEFR